MIEIWHCLPVICIETWKKFCLIAITTYLATQTNFGRREKIEHLSDGMSLTIEPELSVAQVLYRFYVCSESRHVFVQVEENMSQTAIDLL